MTSSAYTWADGADPLLLEDSDTDTEESQEPHPLFVAVSAELHASSGTGSKSSPPKSRDLSNWSCSTGGLAEGPFDDDLAALSLEASLSYLCTYICV